MKRILTLLICVAMLATSLAFTAFADGERTEAADAVIDMIMELDANTSPAQLAAINEAYSALTPEEQASVFNYSTYVNFLQNEYVPTLNAQIESIPEAEFIDIYHSEKDVENAYAKYSVLTDDLKQLVTGHEKIEAAMAKLKALHEFNDNKSVELLNSTMKGLAAYDFDSLKEASEKESLGIYYYFEEVDTVERGDSTTGYYHPNNIEKIVLYKNAVLEMDIKWTDIDVINGWPMPFQVTNGGDGWSGYDFTNGIFWQGDVTGMDHGRLSKINASVPYELTIGVWHHFEITYTDTYVKYAVDGEDVFKAPINGLYDVYIIYPWFCNFEMTNVTITVKTGQNTSEDMLSPFRNYVANPNWTGWTRSSNEEGATMLDSIELALADTRAAYNSLSDADKEKVAGAEQIDRVQALIDAVRANEYPISVVDGSASASSVAFNSSVTVTANAAPEGKVFDRWVVDPEITLLSAIDPEEVAADLTKAELTFLMPDANLTLTATYKDRPPFTPGDVNNDGKINAKDVTSLMKYIVGSTVKNFVEDAADYDGNGKINAKDVTKLMKDLVSA